MYKKSIKTLLFLLFSCVIIGSAGCSSHKLSHKTLTLNAGDTITITANAKVTWSSCNDFVAKVNDEGTVTANHVGETDILAVVDNNSVPCHVSVLPKYEKEFKEPLHDFNLKKDEVKAIIDWTLKKEDDTMLIYNLGEKALEQLSFRFDKNNGKLIQTVWKFGFPFMMKKHVMYLSERYQIAHIDKESNLLIFCNDLSFDDANMVVLLKLDEKDEKLLLSYHINNQNEK